MFLWVSTTPLGLPVVPEVYSKASGSPGLIAATRAVISSGSAASRSRPSATRSPQVMYRSPAGQAAGSRTMIVVSPGSWSRTGCQRASSAAPSSTAIRASQSAATYPICSGASVAYNVTPSPPAWTAPRSASTCSLRFGSMSATRSPGASPRAANPAATSSTRWRTRDQVRDCQSSPPPASAPVTASSEYASASPRSRRPAATHHTMCGPRSHPRSQPAAGVCRCSLFPSTSSPGRPRPARPRPARGWTPPGLAGAITVAADTG